MTDGEFWVAIIIVVNLFASLCILAFFQHRPLEKLESYLKGVKCVEWNHAVWGGGYIGRQMRLSTIVNIVVWPTLYFKLGHIPLDAHKRIPVRLRKQLVAVYAYLFFSMIGLCALYFTLPDKSGG